ncbi:MAG: methyltransferase dimerization domain-containing protein [bacterium]|nr:methyltransferase dimerization domain-containing protein [bacterium]
MFADPTKILELMYAYKTSEALFAANELDVFTLLDKKSLKGEEIAIKLKTVSRATIVLLDFLVTLGLLNRENGRYSNTPIAEKFLVRGSSGYLV